MIVFNSGEYQFTVQADGTASARVIDRDQVRYTPIPQTVEHEGVAYRVTSLWRCFCGCSSLVEAPEIPEGVTDMERCFCGCSSLEKAPKIPEGVTNAASCFHGCRSLAEAPDLPGSMEPCLCNLGQGILCDGGHVFHTMDQRYSGSFFRTPGDIVLQSYEGPGGVVRVPNCVDNIGPEAFAYCSHVTDVILPEGLQYIDRKAFYRSGIKTISLPDTLFSIGELAFAGSALESIDIPDQVQKLGKRAFERATMLQRARLSEGIPYLEAGVFSGCTSLKEVTLPEGLQYIKDAAFRSCTSLERIELPESLFAITSQVFCGCTSLREIFLSDNMKRLGPDAFRDCMALERVRIPENLLMTNGNAFGNNGRMELTGPGRILGPIIDEEPEIHYHPVTETAVFSDGVTMLPSISMLWGHFSVRTLDLPKSLEQFQWYYLARLRPLTRIVTDRDATAVEIALLLDAECVDREGQSFTLLATVDPEAWTYEPDPEYGGIRLTGHQERAGAVGPEGYVTVIVPGEIDGRPVTSIGAGLFDGCDYADAFYVPDSVKRIGSLAFAHNAFCSWSGKELFMRMPEDAIMAEDAFEKTRHTTRAEAWRVVEMQEQEYKARKAREAGPSSPEEIPLSPFAANATNDPAIGTGTKGRPELQPNIWQYFDRLSTEERIRELTHSFKVWGEISGVGWATIGIVLDGHSTRFRISYIGASPADFRRFVKGVADGERGRFTWTSEPGAFPWQIQRRSGIFYVEPPLTEDGFFIARRELLDAVEGMTVEWRDI